MLRPLVSHLPEWITAHLRLWAGLGLLLLSGTAVTWHLGGFEAAPLEPLPTFAAGATITTNEWTIEPLRAWIADTDPTGMPATSGGALLMVELRLGNRTQRSTALFYEALRLANAGPGPDEPWHEAAEPKTLVLLRDPSRGIAIHPGLPARVAAVWDLASASIDQARLYVLNRQFVERRALMGEAGWANAQPLGVLGLAVEDRRRPSAATNEP